MTMRHALFGIVGLAGGLLVAASPSAAITARDLWAALQSGQRPVVIDIRGAGAFAAGHIPGAMNLPAALLPAKPLPPLGRVVVVGDGLDPAAAREAVRELAARPGVEPELLEGGMPAWETRGLPGTRPAGVRGERLRFLSYAEFQRALENPDAVVVTVGGARVSPEDAAGRRVVAAGPGAPGEAALGAVLGDGPSDRLFLVVADGRGAGEAVARRLRAAGARNVAVLAGGQETIERRGRAGRRTRTTR